MVKMLESGAVLDLSMCSFEEGTRLMKAVAREIRNVQVSLGAKGESDVFKMEMGNEAMNTIKNIVMSLIASDDIESALWPCIERGTYTADGITRKINRDLFDGEKARGDYIPILKEGLIFNLTPFFKSLASLVKDIPLANTNIRKLPTTSTKPS
jgi:hypothetical protein